MLEFNKILELLSNHALSQRAKQKILELKPYLNEEEAILKINETTEAKMIIDSIGIPPLPIMKDIDKILELVQKQTMLSPEQLTNINEFLISCKRIKSYLNRLDTQISSYSKTIDSLDDLYSEIENSIRNNQVDDNTSKALKNIRHKLENINSQIKFKLENLLKTKKDYFADNYVTIRNNHYTLPVKKEFKSQINGNVIDVSQSGSTYFIEPHIIQTLNGELAELQIEEENEIRKILYTLTSFVYDYLHQLQINIEAIETLDFIFAKAKLSIEMKANPVKLSCDRRIIIKSGIHPLLNQQNIVPLNFELGQNYNGIVITGPNTGGKTVTLKTVGLLSLMAQSGLHVPADTQSEFTMNNTILCDIGDNQSISENLSTFSSHINNIIDILNNSDSESLILLDELGSGTDPNEGMGIAISILDELIQKNCLFVATTHYPEVKEYAKNTPKLINARMAFDRESLKPLYNLIIGEAGESCALYIAQKLGLPSHMLKRAYYEAYKIQQPDIPNEIKNNLNPNIKHIQKRKINKENKIKNKFHVGDSVMVYPQKLIGIVYKEIDELGEIIVQIQGKKQHIKYKRVKLITPASELYPPDYDFSIIFETVQNRKARHKLERKYDKDTQIVYEKEDIF